MTNLDALQASCNYPIDTAKSQKLLIDQGIDPNGAYTGLNEPFELATANLYVFLLTSANITEGGYQVSMTDKSNMKSLASAIFSKYGKLNPFNAQIRDRSDRW